MAFTRTWNAAYEAIPQDASNVSLGAARIREGRVDTGERFDVDHYFDLATATTAESTNRSVDQGKHRTTTFLEQAGDPTVATNEGALYGKDGGTHSELFWKDETNAAKQLTKAGLLKILSDSNIWVGGSNYLAEYDGGTSGAAKTLDMANGQNQKVSVTANCAVAVFSNPAAGAIMVVRWIQDAGGTNVLTHASGFKKTVGLNIVNSIGANDQDIYTYYYNGSNWCIISAAHEIDTAV